MFMRKETIGTTGLSLRLPVELKNDIDDLAISAKMSTSELVIQIIQDLVDVNKERIECYRALVAETRALWATPKDESVTNNEND